MASVGIGVLAVARRGRDRVLGVLPLVLGVHQLVEAVVWLDVQGRVSDRLGNAAVIVWASIAFVVLPTLVPVGVLVAGWPLRRWWLAVCLVCGVAVSVAMAVDVAANGVSAAAHGHVLDYGIGLPAGRLVIAGYLVSTLGAPLLSADRFLRWFGVAATVGAVACGAAWLIEFASTWCAYAAVLSVILLFWVRRPDPSDTGATRVAQTQAE